jgi:hypothetical protein
MSMLLLDTSTHETSSQISVVTTTREQKPAMRMQLLTGDELVALVLSRAAQQAKGSVQRALQLLPPGQQRSIVPW